MIGAIGSYGVSSYGAYSTQGLGVQNASNLNLTQFNPIKLRTNPNAQNETQGPAIQLFLVPEILQWIANEIEKKYKIKIRNSDIPFSEEELKLIYSSLADIPPEHLFGVDMIVKNRSMQLNLQDAPSNVFAKTFKQNVLGAYDKGHKRIYLFEMQDKAQLPTVLKHEIGHAVFSKLPPHLREAALGAIGKLSDRDLPKATCLMVTLSDKSERGAVSGAPLSVPTHHPSLIFSEFAPRS